MPPRRESRGPQPPSTQSTPSALSKEDEDDDDDMFGPQKETKTKDVVHMITKIVTPLTDYQHPFVGRDWRDLLQITCRDLDFYSGEPSQGCEQFIRPIPYTQVKEWLKQTKPWNIRDDFVTGVEVDGRPFDEPRHEARFLWQLIEIYLNGSDGDHVGLMANHIKWVEFEDDNEYLHRVSTGPINWHMAWLLRRCVNTLADAPNQDASSCDKEKPHVMCYVLDNARLHNDALSTSELTTILMMTCTYAILPEYKRHRVIPVTVISGSARQVRIVQGIVDIRKRSVEIRKTPIIDFDRGVRKNFGKFLALLGWIVGEPVGKTTWV